MAGAQNDVTMTDASKKTVGEAVPENAATEDTPDDTHQSEESVKKLNGLDQIRDTVIELVALGITKGRINQVVQAGKF
jgi:hypothetical protein